MRPWLQIPNEALVGYEVYLLNQPLQCILISVIIIVAIICNSLIIHNIGRCQVSKLKPLYEKNGELFPMSLDRSRILEMGFVNVWVCGKRRVRF